MTNKKMILTKLLPFKIAIFEPIKLPAKLKIAIGMAYLNKIFPCQPKMIIEPRLVKRFTILAFISILGFDFLTSSAHAKIVNLFTNLGSIIIFGWHGNILFQYAIPMAIFNLTGSFIGSKMAILKGNGFVRIIFLLVIVLMILRYSYDIFFKH